MPYEEFSVPAEVVLIHHGVAVFNVYRDDEIREPRSYSYTLDPDGGEYDDNTFDIRDFTIADDSIDPNDHPAILRHLIDTPEWLEEWTPEGGLQPVPYRLTCPECGAKDANFAVTQCTFTAGPHVTAIGVTLTPDCEPATTTVQCSACQASFDLDRLRNSTADLPTP